jgi:hypothetical protein
MSLKSLSDSDYEFIINFLDNTNNNIISDTCLIFMYNILDYNIIKEIKKYIDQDECIIFDDSTLRLCNNFLNKKLLIFNNRIKYNNEYVNKIMNREEIMYRKLCDVKIYQTIPTCNLIIFTNNILRYDLELLKKSKIILL